MNKAAVLVRLPTSTQKPTHTVAYFRGYSIVAFSSDMTFSVHFRDNLLNLFIVSSYLND